MGIGSNRKMCLAHQIRIDKRDIKYKKLDSETGNFLNDLRAILKRLYGADKIKGAKKRLEATDSFDAQLGDLMNRRCKDDVECNIARYQKRYKREKDFMTTFLRQKDVPPDNNSCEGANRVVVCVRGDGEENRTEKGMKANSILFTIKLTDKINGRSFYDHMMHTASASDDRCARAHQNCHHMKNKYRGREVAHNFDHLPHDQTVMSVYIFMRKHFKKRNTCVNICFQIHLTSLLHRN